MVGTRKEGRWLGGKDRAGVGANREKAISHATQIGGQFVEVWLRDRRYWVVRKDGEIINAFPKCDESAALEEAGARVRDEAWKTPEELLRRRVRERAQSFVENHHGYGKTRSFVNCCHYFPQPPF